MKLKILLLLTCAAIVAIVARAQDTNAVVTAHFTAQTSTVTCIAPITLTADQIDALIASISRVGISSDITISSTNLQSIIVNKMPNGNFTVRLTLK